MQIIIHRINTLKDLANVPFEYGVEIDIRGYGSKIFLSHDPIVENKKYDELEEYLKSFHHSFVIFNIKEAGYEQQVIDLAKKYNIFNYFLLDVEFPYLYKATRKDGFRKIAARYSEAEPIEAVEAQVVGGKPAVDWVWVDTNTILPLDAIVVGKLKPFRTCLVCPSRWGRTEEIEKYANKIKDLNFKPDAIMTSLELVFEWLKYEI